MQSVFCSHALNILMGTCCEGFSTTCPLLPLSSQFAVIDTPVTGVRDWCDSHRSEPTTTPGAQAAGPTEPQSARVTHDWHGRWKEPPCIVTRLTIYPLLSSVKFIPTAVQKPVLFLHNAWLFPILRQRFSNMVSKWPTAHITHRAVRSF